MHTLGDGSGSVLDWGHCVKLVWFLCKAKELWSSNSNGVVTQIVCDDEGKKKDRSGWGQLGDL